MPPPQSYLGSLGENLPGYRSYMAAIISAYVLAITLNIVLIYGSVKNNRSIPVSSDECWL